MKWIKKLRMACFRGERWPAHISNVLEGNEPDNNEIYTSYMSTKYGSDVMFSY